MGPGSYMLANGTRGTGDLQFKTRTASVLYLNRKQQLPAAQLQSFSVAGHTFWPHGNFLFEYGLHTYQAKNAFIEYADTTGGVHLAVYYTVEPTGDWNTAFTTFLLRPRGSRQFIMGPRLQKQRLTQAYFLVNQQNKRPSDIYLELGFETLSHFSYAFKKQFGQTLTELQAPARVKQ